MKSLHLISAGLLFLAFCCNPEKPVVKESRALVVTASQNDSNCRNLDDRTKVFLSGGTILKWVSADKLYGFNTDGERFLSLNRGGSGTQSSSSFTFEDWEGVPGYFVFNHSSSTTASSHVAMSGDTAIVVNVTSLQQVQDKDCSVCRWAPVMVGKAGYSPESGYSVDLKNVTGYIRLSFACANNIKSLDISSVEGVPLVGKLLVSTESIDAGEPEAEVLDGCGTVSVYPSLDAGQKAGDISAFKLYTYYVAVIPGSFTPVLTFTDENGRTCTRTSSTAIDVRRASYTDLGVVDRDLDYSPLAQLPKYISFTLGREWNFEQTPPTLADTSSQVCGQSEKYLCNGYEFGISRNYSTASNVVSGYWYDPEKGLCFLRAGGVITFPAIPNYRLQRVSVLCNNLTKLGSKFGFVSESNGKQICAFEADSTCTFHFDDSEVGRTYYLYFNSGIAKPPILSLCSLTYVRDTLTYYDGSLYYDQPQTVWEKAVRQRADLIYGFSWVPKGGTIPTQNNRKDEFFSEGVRYRGIPYSSHWNKGNGSAFVGLSASFYTFLSALNSPQSRLYTLNFHYIPDGVRNNGNGGALYGSVCSTTVSYILGYPIPYTTSQMFTSQVPSMIHIGTDWTQLRLFDAPTANGDENPDETEFDTNHTMVVVEIGRDASGNIKEVTVEEAWGSKLSEGSAGTRRLTSSFEDFCKRMNSYGYHLFRIDQNNFPYKTLPFIEQNPGEVVRTTPEYVCFEFGDRVSIVLPDTKKENRTDTLVTIHVNKVGSYDTLRVEKDGILCFSEPVSGVCARQFRLTSGLYEAYLTDGTARSAPTSFEIVPNPDSNIKCSYDGSYIYVQMKNTSLVPVSVSPNGQSAVGTSHTAMCVGQDATGKYMFPMPSDYLEGISNNTLSIRLAAKYNIFQAPRSKTYR